MKRVVEFHRLGRFRQLSDLDEFEIELHFTLSEEELKHVRRHRGPANRLGLALQIGLLKATGGQPSRSVRIQPQVLRHVAEQIGVPAPDLAGLRGFYPRTATFYQHRAEAMDIAGFRPLSSQPRRSLVAHLNQAAIRMATADELTLTAREWLRAHLYVAPSTRDLKQLCRGVWQHHMALLAKAIRSKVDPDRWPDKLKLTEPGGRSLLDTLQGGPRKRSRVAFEIELEKVRALRGLGADNVDLTNMPGSTIAAHARRMVLRKASEIARLREPGRTVALACYLRWELARRLDLTIDLLMFLISDMRRKAETDAATELARRAPALARSKDGLLDDLDALSLRAELSADGLRQALRDLVMSHRDEPRSDRSLAGMTRRNMAKGGQMLTRLTKSLGELGLMVPKDHPLRSALDVLHTMTDSDKCNLPNDVQNPFGRTWAALIHGEDRAFATQAWRAATLLLVQRSLRNGSVHIPDSRDWRAPDNHMIPLPLWNRDRRNFIRRMGLEQTAGAYLKRLEQGTGIRDANAALVAAIAGLDVARHWGEGMHASSDMMSLDAARGLWSARIDPRRRTRGGRHLYPRARSMVPDL